MEWQPIETAPKDGTIMLGYGECAGEINGPFGEMTVAPVMWRGGRSDWKGFQWDVTVADAYAVWMNPTHWMPLPAPPSDEKAPDR